MLILLSPSKTQETGHKIAGSTIPDHLERTQYLVKELQRLDRNQIARLMQVSDKLAETTWQRFHNFRIPHDELQSSPALLGFRGDVFSEIEADDYTQADMAFAQQHLRILSGLYGILRPLDLIQPYRLEIGGKFQPQQGQNLYSYWRDDVTQSINLSLSSSRNPVVLNLASNEYFKVVERKQLQAEVINVFFKQNKSGKLRTVAIHAKKARGALTNYIIRKKLEQVGDLVDFSYDGYTYAKEKSTENDLVFIRDEES